MAWRCFWTEPTGEAQLRLRRYRSSDDDRCPADPPERTLSYCNADVAIGTFPVRRNPDTGYLEHIDVDEFRGAQWPWPTVCARCGRPFSDDDRWQVNQEPLYARPDGKAGPWPQRDLPPGAMYDATWQPDSWRGADGIALTVVLPTDPPVTWMVDGPASSGGRWRRTGDPRQPTSLSVQPSIYALKGSPGSYHGYLTNGELTNPL